MEDFEAALEVIESRGGGDFEGEKPESLVLLAESALGVKFPPTYREFLRRLGCGSFAGKEFYGLVDDEFETSSVPNGVWATLQERKLSNIPDPLVVVYDAGDGTLYALDTSARDLADESPVVAWHPTSRPGERLERIVPDFGKFFYDTVRGTE